MPSIRQNTPAAKQFQALAAAAARGEVGQYCIIFEDPEEYQVWLAPDMDHIEMQSLLAWALEQITLAE
jgi:hypothetical protein